MGQPVRSVRVQLLHRSAVVLEEEAGDAAAVGIEAALRVFGAGLLIVICSAAAVDVAVVLCPGLWVRAHDEVKVPCNSVQKVQYSNLEEFFIHFGVELSYSSVTF